MNVKVRFKHAQRRNGEIKKEISGTVYHTENHVFRQEHIEVPLETAELFGLRECHTCQRRRLFKERVDDAIVFLGVRDGYAHLRVYGSNLKIEAGKMALPVEVNGEQSWTISDIPEDVAIHMDLTKGEA